MHHAARLALCCAALLALGACGRVAPLSPEPGKSLPVKPLLAKEQPTPEQLLDYPTLARPQRVDELLTRSQPREPDPFDLPPAGASEAPPSPTEASEPAAVTTGPDNLQEPR